MKSLYDDPSFDEEADPITGESVQPGAAGRVGQKV